MKSTATFSKAFIDALPFEDKPYERRDAQTNGLSIRIEGRRKTFVFTWARGKRVTIGPYPVVTIAQARAECPRILARIANGEDPRPLNRRPADSRPQKGKTVRELLALYEPAYETLKVKQGFSAAGLMSLRSVMLEIGGD